MSNKIIVGSHKKAYAIIEKYGMLYQGVKNINRGGWFEKAVVVQTFFIAEDKYLRFANDMNKL